MLKHLRCLRVPSLLVAIILLALPSIALTMNLPLSKDLTVRLSTLDSQGQMQTVSDLVARTDALGKIAFNFPSIPSSITTPFLHIQIIDGTTVLRQTIVPSPQPGSNIDIGVSETTDLQARSILKAVAVSGKLSPLHLLVAQALLRTPSISTANAELIGSAIVAGADAISSVLATEGLSTDQLSTFLATLTKGLADAAAVYRKSVDDSLSFDQNVEAYRRGEAYAVLLQSLINAGSDAGINLEAICLAFTSAGAAAETAIESTASINTLTRASMRLGFVSGILSLSNYRSYKECMTSLSYVGVVYPSFTRVFDVLNLVLSNTVTNQKSMDLGLLVSSNLGDVGAIWAQENNSLATQDLLLMKASLEFYFLGNSGTEYVTLMQKITSRMASMGGVMLGMTPEILLGILGIDTTYMSTPTLRPFELAAWSYVSKEPSFSYTPIPGLIDQLITKPTATPAFDKLAEPYKSIALLSYDISLISSIRSEEQSTAQSVFLANPSNPQRWIQLATVNQILDNDHQRMILVRQHISGVSLGTNDALIYLLQRRFTTF